MIVSTEDIVEEFEAFGVRIKNDVLLDKCIGLCSQYELAADQLAATWLGYAATHCHDEMTSERLDSFEREQLTRKKTQKTANNNVQVNSNIVPVYTAATLDQLQAEDDLLMTYGASPKPTKKKAAVKSANNGVGINGRAAAGVAGPPGTPRASQLRREGGSASPHTGHLSPGVSQPSERYSSRTNSGYLATHLNTTTGEGVGVADELADRQWTAAAHFTPKFTVSSLSSDSHRVMFEKLRESAALQEEAILHMADQLAPAFEEQDWSAMDMPSNERIQCVGRVCCDSVGKLNAASVLLEGSRELAGAQVLPLDLGSVPQYALFPGQVIGVSGVNPSGNRLVVEEVIGGRVPPYPQHPITITQQTGPVQVVVACGPFTTTGNLLYEPLEDLLSTIASDPPHLLLLLGPLLDATHPLLLSSDMTETYQAVVNRVLATIASALAKCATEVFVVSSSRDATSSGVYPTCALNCTPSLPSPRIHLLSDPSMLVVEGVALAMTSMDVVMDLGKEELAFPAQQGDRLSRLVQHVLAQQVLYPISPAPDHTNVSPQLLHTHASLNCKPHVLVLPSDIRHYVKDVCGCVAVNPERLCKGASGGSYARLELRPPTEDQSDRPAVLAAVYKV